MWGARASHAGIEKGSDDHGFTVWPDNDTSSGIRAPIEMKAEAKAIAEAELWP